MFNLVNKSFKINGGNYYITYPCFNVDKYNKINGYFEKNGELFKKGFKGELGNRIASYTDNPNNIKGYGFIDITFLNHKIISGLMVIMAYEKDMLIYFDIMPFSIDIVDINHIPLWFYKENVNKKQKNIPYCIINNRAYSVKNIYSGQKIRQRKKNYKSLVVFSEI